MDEKGRMILYHFPFVIAAVIAIRLLAGTFNRQRINEYMEARGGKVLQTAWAPFGPGWMGGKGSIYEVRYRDHEGNIHEAFASTSALIGVYLTEDRIVQRVKPDIDEEEVRALEDENARLRTELERLKYKDHDRGTDTIKE
jgi:outer membrane murein-binding lipoprotein Lpp